MILNGKRQKELHAPCGGGEDCNFPKQITIPADHYFMMGDNRGASDDSRFWGPVPRDWIIGGAFGPTGLPTGSGSSEAAGARAVGRRARGQRRRRSSGSRLFRYDRGLGVRFVAGADEAGRGCLAGPLVAAAVLFDYERADADRPALAVGAQRLQAAHGGGARGAVPARAAGGDAAWR